jgi:hypothetical protein
MKRRCWESVRERESEIKRMMMWNFVELGILMWQHLEEAKKFLFVSAFNLYIIDTSMYPVQCTRFLFI